MSRQDLQTKKLPIIEGKPKIEKSLFGWQIKDGKKSFQCTSQTEARYLIVWLNAGVDKIRLPKEPKYLARITSELEQLKQKIDEIIETYLGSIMDQKLKIQILHRIWGRLV